MEACNLWASAFVQWLYAMTSYCSYTQHTVPAATDCCPSSRDNWVSRNAPGFLQGSLGSLLDDPSYIWAGDSWEALTLQSCGSVESWWWERGTWLAASSLFILEAPARKTAETRQIYGWSIPLPSCLACLHKECGVSQSWCFLVTSVCYFAG